MKTHIRIPPNQSIDSYLRRFREPTVFHLEPGEYTTRGAFGFVDLDCCMLADRCELLGAGRDETVIRLVDPITTVGTEDARYYEALTAGARKVGTASGMRMQGFTLRLPVTLPVVAIHFWGQQSVVEDVRVLDVVGFRDWQTYPREGFGILMANSHEPGEVNGGNRVSRCVVIQADVAKENYSTGIYVGMVGNRRPMLRSTIESCCVLSADGHAGLACNDLTDIDGCEVYGHRRAVFMDTGPIRCSTINRLRAYDVGWGVDLRQCSPGDVRESITVTDSEFAFRPIGGNAQALLVDDQASLAEIAHGIRFKDCRFVAPDRSTGVATKARLRGKGVGDVAFQSCHWIGKWDDMILQGVKL